MNTEIKIFTLLTCLFVSVNGFCEKYSGGNGTINSPFEISSLSDLRELSETPKDWDNTHFVITADIDASATRKWNIGNHDHDCETPVTAMGFSPIGNQDVKSFTGSLDGNGHTIKNLYINRPKETLTGLFGYLGSKKQAQTNVRNLKLKNCEITGVITGTIAGFSIRSNIENCNTTGKIHGTIETGGVIGFCEETNVKDSAVNMVVKCLEGDAGGCIGYAKSTKLTNCKVSGFVSTQTRAYDNYNAAELIASKCSRTTTQKCSSKVRVIHYNQQEIATAE